MLVKDMMTTNVVTVKPDDNVVHAIRLMLQHRISGLVVTDASGTAVGVVTEGDFMRRAETGTEKIRSPLRRFFTGPGRLAEEYVHAAGRKVSEVMSTQVHAVAEDDTAEAAVALMEKYRIKRLPVVRDGKPVGIISRANFLHALAGLMRDTSPPPGGDAEIRERIIAEIARHEWSGPALVDVVVRNGQVELWGSITDERVRQALIVAAENTAGVTSVRDNTVWIEPMSGMTIGPGDRTDSAPR